MLEVKNLHAKIGDKEILKGIDLVINDGSRGRFCDHKFSRDSYRVSGNFLCAV